MGRFFNRNNQESPAFEQAHVRNSGDDLSLENSPPYNAYNNGNYDFYTELDSESNNSDTTNTYVEHSHMYVQQKSQHMKELPSSPHDNTLINPDQLESQDELHYQHRMFSFLFSKKIPPVPSPEERKPYPWKTCNPFVRLVFWWLFPVMIKGYKRTLTPEDLWYLPDDLKVETVHKKFEDNLQNILDKSKANHLKKHGNLKNYKWPKYCLPIALFQTFKVEYTMSCFLLALSFVCQSTSPLITRRLIDFVEYRYFGLEPTINKGVGYTIGSVLLIFINGLLLNHFFHNSMIVGAHSKSILTKSLLLKSFELSAKSRYQFSVGKITSLMSTDLSRIDLAIGFQPLVICFPIPVIISVVLLLTNLGVTSLVGIGLFIVSLGVCALATKKLFHTRETVVKFTDERINMMREILSNIKIIKFYAWEMAYKKTITKLREREMHHLFTIKVVRNFITAYAVTLPTLTSMISFVTMWATGSMKSPGAVFSSLSLFTILAQAILLLPLALATGADALIGFNRCNDFLSSSEFNDEVKEKLENQSGYILGEDGASEFKFEPKDQNDKPIIEIRNATFEWESFHGELENSSLWDLTAKEKKNKKDKKDSKKNSKNKAPEGFSIQNNKEVYSDVSSNETYFEHAGSDTSSVNQFPGLRNINLSIKKGEFIIITGVIGSGKSSLLNAIAGTMKMSNSGEGSLILRDESLLCGAPWIQNATVKDNILFGRPFDPVKYSLVIRACALEEDLLILPARDSTQIGERGITLSGGQKARINLARAVYAQPEILLFDDVLSAVDARVAKHIISNLFCGMIRNKTRILATHQLSLIENADRIVYLNGDGTIDVGTVNELRNTNQLFKRLFEFRDDIKVEIEDSYKDLEHTEASDTLEGMKSDISGTIIQEEERATNAIPWDIYKKYVTLGSGKFGWAATPIFLLLVTVGTFLGLFTNTWLSFWVEKKFHGRSDYFYVTFYVLFAVLTVIFTAIEFTMLGYINNESAEQLNIRAVAKILHVPMSFIDTTPMGRILNRFTKDTDALDNEIGEQMRLFIFPLALIIGIIILCICYLPWFAIAVPFLGGAFIFIANFYQASSREIKRLEATQRSLVYNNFNETLTGMTVIKAYKAEQDFIKKNDYYLNKMNEAYFITIANQRWLGTHLDVIASAFALIICMLCITEQFDISPSSTGLLMSYVIQIVGILSLTIKSMTQVENEMNSVERLYQYSYNLPQEDAYTRPETQPPAEWPPAGYIQFNNVSLRYRPGLPTVLKNMNLNIYPGEKVGVCGRTGAGKSSIMNALYRLNEIETGNINIDGIDIKSLGLYELRSRLSIIPQDPTLFQGTIRKNLDPFNQYSDDCLWDALRRSGLLDEFTMDRIRNVKYSGDEGVMYEDLHKFHLDQMVDDDGSNFSLGERQLIALARALVRNSKILILDEATSLVDYETDSRIQDTIASEFGQCTILCIAHRLKTILNYDRIIVMDNGEIVEKGIPWDLFNSEGPFKQMCDKANITSNDFI